MHIPQVYSESPSHQIINIPCTVILLYCDEEKLTMAAPTAIPANPICNRVREKLKDEKSLSSHFKAQIIKKKLHPADNIRECLTSEIGVSMIRLSPYFFHKPLLI